jgi:hypothetical protein
MEKMAELRHPEHAVFLCPLVFIFEGYGVFDKDRAHLPPKTKLKRTFLVAVPHCVLLDLK